MPYPDGFPASYAPIEHLKNGGFGDLWLATDPEGIRVVIKIPKLEASAPSDITRFRREALLLSQLNHENILPILDYDVTSEVPWFAVPLAIGNLADVSPQITVDTAITLFVQVLRGVEHAHRNQIIHRDLKPENILIFQAEPGFPFLAKVCDFGLGRSVRTSATYLTSSFVGAGTRGYAAPEQWLDFKNVDHRADIYALGKILQNLLDTVSYPESALCKRLGYCVRTATSEEPGHRYQSVSELLSDVELLTANPRALDRPIDAATDLVHQIISQPSLVDLSVRQLAQLLHEHRDNSQLLFGLLARIPLPIVRALTDRHETAFLEIIDSYASHLHGAAVDTVLAALRLFEEVHFHSKSQQMRLEVAWSAVHLASQYEMVEFEFLVSRILESEQDPWVKRNLRAKILTAASQLEWCRSHLNMQLQKDYNLQSSDSGGANRWQSRQY